MHSEEKAQREFNQEVVQHASMAIYPQLCGSWPGDEWPEDVLSERRGDFVDLCAGSHVEYASESEDHLLKLKRHPQ